MGKKSKQNNHHHNKHGKVHHPVVGPAPFLVKRRVVLEDTTVVQGNQAPYDAIQSVNANGVIVPGSASRAVPQPRIWNQYAAMYDFYQVKHISFRFYPYRYQGNVSASPTGPTQVFNTFSVIDPDAVLPANTAGPASASQLFSFGNCKICLPYAIHARSMSDWTNLGISKQDEIIKKTGGAASSRALYDSPATLYFATTAPNFSSDIVGQFVYKIEYEFSGLKVPGLLSQGPNLKPDPQADMPMPVLPSPPTEQSHALDDTVTKEMLYNQLALLVEKKC